MSQANFDKLLTFLNPLWDFWTGARISTFAARERHAWVNLASRIEILSEASAERHSFYMDLGDAFALVTYFDKAALSQLLHAIVVHGYLPLEGEGPACKTWLASPGGLPRLQPAKFTWRAPDLWEENTTHGSFRIPSKSVAMQGTSDQYVHEFISRDKQRPIESILLRSRPLFDGLNGLYAHLFPPMQFDMTREPIADIVAPYPFALRHSEDKGLRAYVPSNVEIMSLSASVFYQPGSRGDMIDSGNIMLSEEKQSGLTECATSLEWADTETQADVKLFFEELEVARGQFSRWDRTATLEAAFDNFFDPDYSALKRMLGGNRKRKEDFEFGVMRLLNLLQIPVTWYGQGSDDAKPDLGGVVRRRDGLTLVLVECTLEKPNQKFSGLRERSRALLEHLGINAAVLQVVATAVQPAPEDYKSAGNQGISLVGSPEIEQLLKLLQGRATRRKALAYLLNLQDALAYPAAAAFGLPD